MCYSAKIWAEYQSVRRHYSGEISWPEFLELVRMRERSMDMHTSLAIKIPDEMIAGLIAEGGSAAKQIALFQKRWKVTEQRMLEQAVQTAGTEYLAAEEKLKAKATKTNQKGVLGT